MEINSIAVHAALLWGIFLTVSAVISLIVRKLKKHNFFPRLAVWLVIIPLFLLALYFGKWTFFVLIAVSFLASYYELVNINAETKFWQHLVSLTLAVPWLICAQLLEYSSWLIVPALLALAAVLFIFKTGNRESRWNLPILAFIVGVGFSYWIYLNKLGSFRLVLFVFSVVALCDIMAFVTGKMLGKYGPFPKISPNKTIAGYLGGFLSAVLAGYFFWFAVPELNFFQVTLAGLLLAVSGTSGDLFGSKIKRLYGLKDFSCLLGPMGGIIDRLDSQLITAGLFYYYLILIIK